MTLVIAAPVALVATALVIISATMNQRIAEQLAEEVFTGTTQRVSDDVMDYLGDAVRVSNLYARRIREGRVPTDAKPAAWQPFLFDDLFSETNVASICFGNARGDAVWFLYAHNRYEYGHSDGSRDCDAIEFIVDRASGTIDTKPIRQYRYDPRERPWYSAAMGSIENPVWTPVYFWFGMTGADSETGTGYARAIVGKDGNVAGVLIVDVTLHALSAHLQRLPIAKAGSVFIVDDQDMIVAASTGPVNTADGQRLALAKSSDPMARAAAEALASPAGAVSSRRVSVNGEAARIAVNTLTPYNGIRWRIVSVLNERSFMGQANATRRTSIVLGAIATAAGLLLGSRLSPRLSLPLLRLVDHVSHVGRGDFDRRLELNEAKELRMLSAELNRMSAGLKQRLQLEQSLALAADVQHSLLPDQPPCPAGLDVAGHHRYCDATGGDYYDFIDVAKLGECRTLVAVGDVAGHGISAALLMATARAAVRASADHGNSIGQIMNRVNHLLSSDMRHGLFMTLVLMAYDPAARCLRWASAGHDPGILYSPESDRLTHLDGAGIPLCVEQDYPYEEYKQVEVKAGDVIVIGTDGIWEARNEQNELFGHERLCECVRAAGRGTAAQISYAIDTAISKFRGRAPILDDITFVVIRVVEAGA